jgi:hypothetical protein
MSLVDNSSELDVNLLRATALKCYEDYEFFAKTCLRVVGKDGSLVPFIMNKEQKALHEKLQAQLAKKGKVRAIILKARQIGISTYIEGRFYWRLWKTKVGQTLRVFILCHKDEATDNLFNMVKRYHENMPVHLKPPLSRSNIKELIFADTGCLYSVATAGGVEIGRGSTLHFCHLSEMAFWPNAEMHVTSLLNTALSGAEGTECIIESTANGIGNVFHRYWQAAAKGQSDYEAIFFPWFFHDEYRTDVPEDWNCPEEFLEYGQLYELDWEQIYWIYLKNRESAFAAGLPDDKFTPKSKQEYPANADESFVTSGESFIPPIAILRARKPPEIIRGTGPIILGVDPARTGDKVGIIDRCGRRAGERIAERWEPGGNLVHLSERIAHVLDKIRPDAVCIDVGGNGAGVYDCLLEWGYANIIHAINFGSKPVGRGPTGEEMYFNRRAEMYDNLRQWFNTEGGVQIPDDDSLQMDLTSIKVGPGATRFNNNNELIIEDKEKIKARIGSSPDLSDALCLTFAIQFYHRAEANWQPPPPRRKTNRRTGY